MDRRAVLAGSLAAPLASILGVPRRARAGAGRAPAGRAPAGEPDSALAALRAGNQRFAGRRPRHGHDLDGALATAAEQHPFAAVLGCIDSRVPVEAVFDQDFGAVFVVRSAGHVLDQAVRGSVEFAVAQYEVPVLLVLGHTRCGAVQATLDAARDGTRPDGALGYLVDEITPAVHEVGGGLDPTEVTRVHVRLTADRLRGAEPARSRVDEGTLAVVGAVYDVDTGRAEPLY